jgi:predicted Zn-dependent peptidase
MIEFNRFVLGNGLRVLVHEDHTTPMAVVNVLYDVGARDEHPDKTGFAHLFEHLMFGGSGNIPDYDEPLQRAGGENNAYTTNDLTNYYCQLPVENMETAFWLESDRMLGLAFSKKSLEVQRKVVCEEFKEHYLNKPYGDIWHKMRELCYQVHPYRWMTIGKELSHVEKANIEDVKAFFYKHYRPINAILVVAGAVETEHVKQLAEKWFGDIPSGEQYVRDLPVEPAQTEARHLDIYADVPANALIMAWHMDARLEPGYYAAELLTEILGDGGSSRLYQALVKERKILSALEVHHFGSSDKGLLAIESRLVNGVDHATAQAALEEELEKITREPVSETELQKVKNKTESMIVFEDMSLMNRASSLAHYELLGDAHLMNTELEKYRSITADDLLRESQKIFRKENSNTLYYHIRPTQHAE